MKIPKSKSLATKTRSTDFSHKKWRAVKKKKAYTKALQ